MSLCSVLYQLNIGVNLYKTQVYKWLFWSYKMLHSRSANLPTKALQYITCEEYFFYCVDNTEHGCPKRALSGCYQGGFLNIFLIRPLILIFLLNYSWTEIPRRRQELTERSSYIDGEGAYVFVTPWRSVRACYGCKHCPVHVEGKPTMAPKLERFDSPGKGNGLRATAGIKRGQLVYSAEPLACCVSNKLARDVCHHCFTRWDRRSSEIPAPRCERKGCSVV